MNTRPLVLSEVIGDVIDQFFPTVSMAVSYNENDLVINGRRFSCSAITQRPNVELSGAEPNAFFTLVMTDPDVPGPGNPKLRERLHWIVADIPGNKNAACGRELISYEEPVPEFGIHRIVFILFQQKNRESVAAVPPAFMRNHFSTRRFAEENELGLPVAAFHLNAQKDPKPKS